MSDNNLVGKRAAAQAAAALVKEGMLVGLGTGSTAAEFIRALATRCQRGLHVQAIASSKESHALAQALGIPLLADCAVTRLDVTVDGADEIDGAKRLLKGGGGALLREKILATFSDEMIVIVDQTKIVQQIGNFPLAVEITPFCYTAILQRFTSLNLKHQLRQKKGRLVISDNGNYLVDCDVSSLKEQLVELDEELRTIPGVLETGLFLNLAGRVIIGYADGHTSIS